MTGEIKLKEEESTAAKREDSMVKLLVKANIIENVLLRENSSVIPDCEEEVASCFLIEVE